MKLLFKQFLVLVPLLLRATAMDMDMDMDEDDTTALTAVADVADNSTIEPIPHEDHSMHGLPILETKLSAAELLYWESYNTTTFFNIDAPRKSAFWIHVFTTLFTFIVMYPITLVLNNVSSKWYIPVLTLNLATVITSVICLQIFGATAPLLYPGQVYGKMSVILLFVTIAHYTVAVLNAASRWISGEWFTPEPHSHQSFIPLEDLDLERGDGTHSPSPSPSTLIDENGPNTPPPQQEPYKDSLDLGEDFYKPKKQSHTSIARDGILARVFTHPRVQSISQKFSTVNTVIFNILNYPLLGYLFAYVMVGISVGNLMGKEARVFNLLAHFIKGGVFVLIGLFSLARYCGVLEKHGLAWNKCVLFKNQIDPQSFWYRWTPHGMFTMEFYESSLIFFYGSTNIFLEHLAGAAGDGSWKAKDLQHASIAFMYIGSGLCGLITERLLSDWRFNQVLSNTNINPSAIHAGSPGFSPNPFPVFTIFWTGILMSQHQQSSMISTSIHMQWGYLLAFGSFFRLLSFFLIMLQPNKNLAPSRPFTELITSFCLIAGGAIFMQSTDQVIEAMEYRGLTEMFTLNVNVGVVALLMAWEMILLIWKDNMSKK